MEIHQIRYFLAVCDKHNFTRAAQYSNVSQPSLTQAVKKLEDELGGELFLRDRAGCQLTALGRLIEPKLRQIYEQVQTTKSDAVRFERLDKIPIRIGLMHTVGSRLLAPSIARFQKERPVAELELFVEPENHIVSKLQSGDFDLIINASARDLGPAFDQTKLYEERYAFVFSPAHRFNQKTSLSLQDLKTEPYLDRLNCEFRNDLTDICSQRSIDLYANHRSNDEQWILDMARSGLGVAIMPEYSLPEFRDDLGSRYLYDPALSREIHAIFPKRAEHSSEVGAIIKSMVSI